nr:14998_t:CDS:2 [Entrophospora candida]
MHAIGVITSFILFCIGIYARHGHIKYKRVTWVFALFSSFVILLAMGGQIDLFLKAKYTVEHPPFHGGTTKLGASGFTLVVIPLVFSFLSVFAFYIGGQSTTEGGGIDRSNGNGNMGTGITKQPSVSEYSPSYLYNDQQHAI